MEKCNVGIVGIGNISGIYLKNLTTVFSDRINLLGCADLIPERAKKATEEYKLPKEYSSVDALINDPDIDIVLNLTIPIAHYDVCLKAIEAGKHTYVEKPLSIKLDEGKRLFDEAEKKGVLVGGAPDTFLGGGIQTCRKLIDDNWIGTPVAVTAILAGHGHESWHPDPEFYYKAGGGPMFDMGPYYLTALINLIGPVKRITGSTRISFPERTITSEAKYGTKIMVEVPTHIAGVMDFQNGAVGTIITSFDVWAHEHPGIEVYGTHGSLSVPNPNSFGGPAKIKRAGAEKWAEVPLTHGYTENSRGLGVADMADAIKRNTPFRASGALTYHVLECMHGFHIASDEGKHYNLTSPGIQPAPLPM
ncbi:MAG: Gfo/Idh/MocA family oxidoreductase [Spirochaetales bacterium]|jgi:predicted dehydrogenase|nr:Gfo/Idh/MocA family oxidoreductase [Spirochaetales bacterium]